MQRNDEQDFLDRSELLRTLRALRRGDFSVRMPENLPGIDGEVVQVLNEIAEVMQGRVSELVRLSEVARVVAAVARGDLTQRVALESDRGALQGEALRIANVVNTMVDQLNAFASEVSRVAREVGTEGKLGGQAQVPGVAGTWKDLTDNVNSMAANLTGQVRNIAEVTTAVAKGDLSRKITVDVSGEILELKSTINTMVDQLNAFASEVSRVAREVGTEGKLGGQAQVPGVAGTWRYLTNNVNSMAGNLTAQVRSIAEVTTAVANGDLSKKITVDVQGEILELKSTINTMVDQLNAFAFEVSRVAREVGTEGNLGGQARVPGVAGTWKDLTDNVNAMAANLTAQVRGIAQVVTAVTAGELDRKVVFEAQGEVAALKDYINEMIRALKETTLKNEEQDWLKTNLAKFSRMVQGHRDLNAVARMVLAELAPMVNAQHGVLYYQVNHGTPPHLELLATYAALPEALPARLAIGEGLVGQCALEKKPVFLDEVPQDYVRMSSGLGSAMPANVIILPVLFEGGVKAVIELASFRRFGPAQLAFLDQLTETLGIVFNTIEANMRTEGLLQQSQSLTRELQSRQSELTQTNDRLEQQAYTLQKSESLLIGQQEELKLTNERIQEKVAQLALSSRYKSEFLATMSHELRTPLNSLLILARMLGDNSGGNLTSKQVEYAQNIHAAGADLLSLISDILDLAKIESGTVSLNIAPERVSDLLDFVGRSFRQVSRDKGLELTLEAGPDVPAEIETDAKRLQQILKNLLSNAVKFTQQGSVSLRVVPARSGWTPGHGSLDRARRVLAFEVSDTGIGIASSKQQIIFEAFHQADGSTSREFGGTGLGLSISRELTRLLGGEIQVRSVPGKGSTFTLYMPLPEPAAAYAGLGGLAPPLEVPEDDRETLQVDDPVVLIVDEGASFASTLVDLVHGAGLKAIVASSTAQALAIAREARPAAISLNLNRGDLRGWSAFEALLRDPATRAIPVSAYLVDSIAKRCLHVGARGVPLQPSDAKVLERALAVAKDMGGVRIESVALVERDRVRRDEIIASLHAEGARSTTMDRGFEILGSLRRTPFDALVIGRVPGGHESSLEWLQEVAEALPPVSPPMILLEPDAPAVVLPRMVESLAELLEETARFLHREVRSARVAQPEAPGTPRRAPRSLAKRKVLVVDDDIRNIFALASALEGYGMEVVEAENGKQAIERLQADGEVDIILMDLMMPELDGLDTIRIIRGLDEFRHLPIVAVTAKAMAGDREKSLEAGASDYVAKPVDMAELLATMGRLLPAADAATQPTRRHGEHGEPRRTAF